MSEQVINAAERLYCFLQLARAQQNQGKTSSHAWCEIFEIPEPESEEAMLEVISRLQAMRELFDEVIRDLTDMEAREDLFIEPIRRMKNVIPSFVQLGVPFNQFSGLLSQPDMTSLTFVMERYSSKPALNEKQLKDDEISDIRMQINELYEQIFASDLPQSVKTVMLDIVNELQRAVHEYKVRGAKGLKKSLAKVFGGLAANADELQKSAGTDELAALAKLVVTVEKAYTTVSNAKMIYGAVTTILPMLGSGS